MAGGMHGWGVCGRDGVHGKGSVWLGGACVLEKLPLKWAVRILLECILVFN